MATRIVPREGIRWAIDTFKPYKSIGSDGILPGLLQQVHKYLISQILHILRACIAIDCYTLKSWRVNKVILSKPGKAIRNHVLHN